MKTIIVGFDFSTGSAHAVDLAIDIANRWKLDVRLVYVKERNEDEAPIREEIERRNLAVAHLLKGIRLNYVIREGKVPTELSKQAEEDEAALVVVGTNGMSGSKKNWIGTNTYQTITTSKVPVLSVREEYQFNKKMERIVLPMDSTPTTRQKAGIAALVAKTFDSEVHVIGLYSSDNKSHHQRVKSYVNQVSRHLAHENIRYIEKDLDAPKNLTQTTLEYADEINADLIIIMTEQEHTLSNIIMGSYAQQMLKTSNIPVLTVRPEDINSVSR